MPTHHSNDTESGGVRSVQRAIEIMSLLNEQHPTMTIREIVEATGLPKTTVLRIVQTLEYNGMLSATPNGYLAGPGLWRWAYLAKNSWEPPEGTRALMRELVARQLETVNIYVVHGLARVCIAQEESPMALRHVIRVGDELPLWAGASSKVLLRDAPESLLERIVRSAPAGAEHLAALQEGITRVVRDGYAVSHGEREIGLSAIAVPILGRQGEVVASLSYSGPTSRFTEDRLADMIAHLQWAAEQLTERGFDHPLRTPLAGRVRGL